MKGWWVDCNLEKIYLGAKIKLERRGFTQLEEFERTSAIRTVERSDARLLGGRSGWRRRVLLDRVLRVASSRIFCSNFRE